MTGGWKPYDDEEYWERRLPLPVELSEGQVEVDEMLARLHRAARFKRLAMRVLREIVRLHPGSAEAAQGAVW